MMSVTYVVYALRGPLDAPEVHSCSCAASMPEMARLFQSALESL